MPYPVSVTFVASLAAGVLCAAALAAWPGPVRGAVSPSPAPRTLVSWSAWHLVLNATRATGFDVDAPVIPLSWEDAGSGVAAFFASALVLTLVTERRERASRVIGAATIAGLVAMALDLFV